jgi:hypothetical protein
MILPVVLKADSDDIVEIGTVIISLAKIERTGYDSFMLMPPIQNVEFIIVDRKFRSSS